MSIDLLIAKAKSYSKRGNLIEAKNILEPILLKFPSNKRIKKILNNFNQSKNVNKKISLPEYEINRINNLKNTGSPLETYKQTCSLIEKYPDEPFLHNMIGVINLENDKVEASINSFNLALKFSPKSPEIYYNLGNCYREFKEYEKSISFYKKAIDLKPGLSIAHHNLGISYTEKLSYENALNCYIKAINLNPFDTNFHESFYDCLSDMDTISYSEELVNIILKVLDENNLRSSRESNFLTKILINHPNIKNLIIQNSKQDFNEELETIIYSISKIPLFIKLLKLGPIGNLQFEELLTKIRYNLLYENKNLRTDEYHISFMNALAIHCFENEYLFEETNEEKQMVNVLEEKIDTNFINRKEINFYNIALLGCYRQLNTYDWIHDLSDNNSTSFLNELLQKQVNENKKQKEIIMTIAHLNKIQDKVSTAVKQQYEENPYPRWSRLQKLKPQKIKSYLEKLKIFPSNTNFSETPKVLIAGCGTGQQAIEASYKYQNSNILAIDLSYQSLSYAQMKAEEFKVENIEFKQGDILELQSLNVKFDLVECSGVLHHMDDPFSGWKVLCNKLKPGGLMLIGLYSELARNHIKSARDMIDEKKLTNTPKDIKYFRKHLNTRKSNLNGKDYSRSIDFYSISGCRDLLFHVQELRYTIPEIQESINKLGLRFLGFQFPNRKIIKEFNSINQDKNSFYSLEKWNEFEKLQKNTFSGMYQFWLEKI